MAGTFDFYVYAALKISGVDWYIFFEYTISVLVPFLERKSMISPMELN